MGKKQSYPLNLSFFTSNLESLDYQFKELLQNNIKRLITNVIIFVPAKMPKTWPDKISAMAVFARWIFSIYLTLCNHAQLAASPRSSDCCVIFGHLSYHVNLILNKNCLSLHGKVFLIL